MGQAIDDLNKIKNPRFTVGRTKATGWHWTGDPDTSAWSREMTQNGYTPVMTIRSQSAVGWAAWDRPVRCKPDEHYRLEIVVCCDCQPADDRAGFLLTVQPLADGQPAGAPAELPAPAKLDQPTILRAYYHAPPDVRCVEIRVGLFRSKGWARIHEVLMLPILEPEAKSHVQSAPPPPYAYPPAKRVGSICVCTAQASSDGGAATRPIVDLLRRRFGVRSVRVVSPATCKTASLDADAVILPDDKPPAAVSSLSALYRLAEGRIVVLSLPAFAQVAPQACEVRTVEQPDDPIHAMVRYANFITIGFAIDDIFPYAWRGRDRRNFVQRHYWRRPALRDFCNRHGFEAVLLSVCETDATSDRPVCLYKPTEGGAIVVLDVQPVESVATNFDEPDLAFYLLLNILGQPQTSLGQYVSPARSEKELRDEVAEVGSRFAGLAVRGDDHPDRPRRDQFVEVGGGESYGLIPSPRPLILIRSGLCGDDSDGVYGTLLWLKNLVRPGRYACPYAGELIARYRLAWIPLCSEWHVGQGWRRPPEVVPIDTPGGFEPNTIDTLIDVTSTPLRQVRVVVADETVRRRCAELLPGLARRFCHGRFFYRCVPPGKSIGQRTALDWRMQELEPLVVRDQGAFDSDLHRNAAAAGATLIRLEFPGPMADLTTGSIWRTDLVATTLEHVIGLQYGWLAMNRRTQPVRVTPPKLGPGTEARVWKIRDGQPAATPQIIQPGSQVWLQTATALCIPSH